jgi:hypothetical protein
MRECGGMVQRSVARTLLLTVATTRAIAMSVIPS